MPRPPEEYLRCIPPLGLSPLCIVEMVSPSLLVFHPETDGALWRSLLRCGRSGLMRWSACDVCRSANALRRPSAFAPLISVLPGLWCTHARESAPAFSVCSWLCQSAPQIAGLWFFPFLCFLVTWLVCGGQTAAAPEKAKIRFRFFYPVPLLERYIHGKHYYLLLCSFCVKKF